MKRRSKGRKGGPPKKLVVQVEWGLAADYQK